MAVEVFQGDTVYILIDHFAKAAPKRQGKAAAAVGAKVFLAVQTGNGGKAALHGAQDLACGILAGLAGEPIAALAAAPGFYKARAGKPGDDLLQIFHADLLAGADLLQRHIFVGVVACKLDHQPQRIAAFCGKFHRTATSFVCFSGLHFTALVDYFHSIALFKEGFKPSFGQSACRDVGVTMMCYRKR